MKYAMFSLSLSLFLLGSFAQASQQRNRPFSQAQQIYNQKKLVLELQSLVEQTNVIVEFFNRDQLNSLNVKRVDRVCDEVDATINQLALRKKEYTSLSNQFTTGEFDLQKDIAHFDSLIEYYDSLIVRYKRINKEYIKPKILSYMPKKSIKLSEQQILPIQALNRFIEQKSHPHKNIKPISPKVSDVESDSEDDEFFECRELPEKPAPIIPPRIITKPKEIAPSGIVATLNPVKAKVPELPQQIHVQPKKVAPSGIMAQFRGYLAQAWSGISFWCRNLIILSW